MSNFTMTPSKWVYNYSFVKREFWTLLTVIIITFVICITTCGSTTHKLQGTDFIDQAFEKYERDSGRKIYPYGRECLRREALKRGYTTEAQILFLIKENESRMWK